MLRLEAMAENDHAVVGMGKYRNSYLVFETILVFLITGLLAELLFGWIDAPSLRWLLYGPLLLFQGLWCYRIYIVGHETAHKKLFPGNLLLNDVLGSLVLLPILVPINIYRKIHYYHHGFNRKDVHTSALETFVVRGRFVRTKTVFYYLVWYIGIFCGGFFIHSLVSVFLFLFVPPRLAERISPAFKGWKWQDQVKAILLFGLGVLGHAGVYHFFGKQAYWLFLGYPLLSFAWVLSLLVYIFHYDTTIGSEVRYNVRSVRPVPVLSWILMNFNEHATHHQYPNIPWYDLPRKRKSLPAAFADKNQTTWSFWRAVFNQLKGPNIVYEH
ncbi:MAG: fatty acid desaturase [Lewinella sp.]|nr:fatty acid desaturase [Lewinella sp.]